MAVLLLAASAAWSALRSHKPNVSAETFEAPAPAGSDETVAIRDQPAPEPGSARPAAPIVVTATNAADSPAISLEARRMSATLVNATLTYRLTVTNTGAEPLVDMAIGGDMVAAHASRGVEELLASETTALPDLHAIASLAPGESVMLGGDIRLPLSAIRPIRHGAASLFVPLVRISAAWTSAGGARRNRASTYLVGPLPAGESDRLQPFRLDLGPRQYAELGQRRLEGIS
ncbi:MAG: hypothetical protein KGM93_01440 [Sphingomonadales bacterium]|nr:hypothetical protein [Sphingomonadales bacterium]